MQIKVCYVTGLIIYTVLTCRWVRVKVHDQKSMNEELLYCDFYSVFRRYWDTHKEICEHTHAHTPSSSSTGMRTLGFPRRGPRRLWSTDRFFFLFFFDRPATFLQTIKATLRVWRGIIPRAFNDYYSRRWNSEIFLRLKSERGGMFWVPGGAGPLWPPARSAQCQQWIFKFPDPS